MSQRKAEGLLAAYPLAQIIRQLGWIDQRRATDKGAVLATAIAQDWAAPQASTPAPAVAQPGLLDSNKFFRGAYAICRVCGTRPCGCGGPGGPEEEEPMAAPARSRKGPLAAPTHAQGPDLLDWLLDEEPPGPSEGPRTTTPADPDALAEPAAAPAANARAERKPLPPKAGKDLMRKLGLGLVPNSTQVPDLFFDEVMPLLQPSEWVVLCYIIRRTYGFRKHADTIPITQFVEGKILPNGVQVDKGTGLSKVTVVAALRALTEHGLIRTYSTVGSKAYTYEVAYTPGRRLREELAEAERQANE